MQFDYRLNLELLSATLAVCGDSSEEILQPSPHLTQPVLLKSMVSYISQKAFGESTVRMKRCSIFIFERILRPHILKILNK